MLEVMVYHMKMLNKYLRDIILKEMVKEQDTTMKTVEDY